ncbi:MAG: putative porin [Phycisphaerae bacterium]|nr:putative porin [Phycisphaerae bacterium]
MLRNVLTPGCIVTLLLLPFTPSLRADDVAALKAQVKQLQSRLETLESRRTDQVEKEELAGMMKEILDEAQATPALPAWMKNLTLHGDFRLRFEHQSYQGRRGGGNALNNPRVGERKDRNRIRMRLRFGFTKTWWDEQMEVGFRLATGEDNQPASTNQTMTGDFSKKPVWIDLMYAKYKPNWLKGLEIGGGKIWNPIKTRTMLTWDGGLCPEGLYVDYVAPFFGEFKPYAQMGFWMVNEEGTRSATGMNAGSTLRDTVMYSYSAGFEWKFMDALEWFFGATYYDYHNADASTGGWLGRYGADGQWAVGPGGQTPTQNAAAATQAYPAADYGLLELTTKVGWKFGFMPQPLERWTAWFTFVHNCRDDYNVWKNPPIPAVGGLGADRHFQNDPNAYGLGIQAGENKKKNDFSLAYAYYYMEYGSVVPGFGDGTLGGPNNQGHLVQAIYNIDDFLTLGGLMVLYQPIHTNDNPANAAANNTTPVATPAQVNFPHSLDMTAVFRLELIWKF